jgi:MFS family permease
MPTILGELSDASNRTSVFAYLPIFNWLGAVIGPLIGGYLSNVEAGITDLNQFP